jgi:23S rRNA pseudouridine1911/1915/1917 synthase
MKWVYDGITVNGEHSYVTRTLHAGDVVGLKLPAAETQTEPYPIPIEIVYEDEDLLLVNKPSQMPIYPTPGHDCDSLANGLSFYMAEKQESFAFHPIFRLDKNTSGLVVVAKHSYSASLLAFGVSKTYFAICEGILTGSGTIDAPIRLKEGHGIQREVGEGDDAQRAVTHWSAVSHHNGHTLLEIQLETGRTHQIRVHFSHIGHPLAGDDLYGAHREWIKRQALHCGRVSFVHPITKERMEFDQPFPSDMENLLKEV